ncbi:MAG: BamA/OMP85 family outer membrane protein [Candidatus Binataceae bacterium]
MLSGHGQGLKKLACCLIALAAWAAPALALTVEQLNPSRNYRTERIAITGNHDFANSELLGLMQTKANPAYEFWKKQPPFEPGTFTADIERLGEFYRSRGYYRARVTYDLDVSGDLVAPRIIIDEGQPVTVDSITVDIEGGGPSPQVLVPAAQLPLKRNDIFTQSAYQLGDQQLLDLYMRSGYADAKVKRRAEVYVGPGQAHVRYTVRPGVRDVFGTTTVAGTKKIDPRLVLRELTYKRGERFSSTKIESSRNNILALNLFRSVQFVSGQNPADPAVVPIEIRVHEKPPRSVSLQIGYNTETQFNASLAWQHYNFLGGGRQLLLSATYSGVTSALAVRLVQPYLYTRNLRGILGASANQEIYQTYTLYASRFEPRLENQFTPTLSGYLGYRLDYLKFNSVAPSTIAALGGIRSEGVLSGPAVGLLLNTTENPLNPQRGEIISFDANTSADLFGGGYRYYRIAAEARKYTLLGWNTVLANRLKIGIADTYGAHFNIPLSERFYSGGEGSIRGYGLRRVGPLSAANDPLGGLSVIEGSIELRHPLFWKLSGAAFFDFGQVSVHPFDLPLGSLVYGWGPALSFDSPVGPIRLDLGFPSKTPRGDSSWQVYFSIGQFY